MLNQIVVFPPDEEGSKKPGTIIKPDKFVATENPPWGPFGYGNTPKEAILDLKQVLHLAIDQLPAYLAKKNGVTDCSIGVFN